MNIIIIQGIAILLVVVVALVIIKSLEVKPSHAPKRPQGVTRKKVYDYLKKHPHATVLEISKAVGVGRRMTQYHLQKLGSRVVHNRKGYRVR